MIYLYDVLLNFNDKYNIYEYFDWCKNDLVVNVKKIILFKVDYKTLFDFYNYKIKVDKLFIKNINCNYSNRDLFINYLFIITNGKKSIAIGVNKNGFVEYKSTLSYEDEDYSNRLALSLKMTNIKYKIVEKSYVDYNLRDNKQKKDFLKKEFTKLYKNNEINKLKCYYLEIFDQINNDLSYIYDSLISGLNNQLNKYDYIYNILKNNTSLIEK